MIVSMRVQYELLAVHFLMNAQQKYALDTMVMQPACKSTMIAGQEV